LPTTLIKDPTSTTAGDPYKTSIDDRANTEASQHQG
jgi:hypothetical protein